MSDINTSKVDGNTVSASEFNQLAEIDNLISTSGQTPSTANLEQQAIASARYSSAGNFFTDSGTANAYVLSPVSPFKSPVSSTAGEGYYNGMVIRFRAGNANSGASTVNVNNAGSKSLVKSNGSALTTGDIPANTEVEFVYNGTNFVQSLSSSANINALANLNGSANKIPYFNGVGSMALADLQPNRNAIINGDFNVWQRGTSFTSPVDGTYVADRWLYSKISSSVHDITRSTDVPTVAQAGRLFSNSLKVDCQTIDSSIASGDLVRISQRIEGFNWLPLAQKTITLSFWVKATKTGIYCVSLGNSGADRSYVAEYTVNASNTWEFKTITFTASPSAGTWNYENGVGLALTFTLASGTTFQTTKDTWQTGSFFATANQVNACDSTSNDFFIAGVQLEAGSVATPFEYRTFQQELFLCQRYYEYGIAFALAFASGGAITQKALFPFKAVKRTSSPSSSLSVISGGATSPTQVSINAYSLWFSYGASGAGIEGQFNVIINDEL